MARKVIGPNTVSTGKPRKVRISFSVSVDFALRMASKIAWKVV